MAEVAISLPFTIDSYGNIVTTTDPSKIWSDRVRSVIGTNIRERVMLPDFGTLVPSAFMETTTSADSIVQSEVKQAFYANFPLLSLQAVSTTYDEYSSVFTVSIVYDLPNNETVTTTVTLVTIDGTSPIVEESL